MGRSIKRLGESWKRISSTPKERLSTIEKLGIKVRETKIKLAVDSAGRHWKKGMEYDVLKVDTDGRLVVGYKASNYRAGKLSPHHHGLVIKK
jgi:hypothetical protein